LLETGCFPRIQSNIEKKGVFYGNFSSERAGITSALDLPLFSRAGCFDLLMRETKAQNYSQTDLQE
tara:strand:- start:445 stop:642 length:198 start_codon:yes stop_codon:yes gene_type:complete